MTFGDLTDTQYVFTCDFLGDAFESYPYDFCARVHDEKHYRSLNQKEIDQLRNNCKRILQVTNALQGGY